MALMLEEATGVRSMGQPSSRTSGTFGAPFLPTNSGQIRCQSSGRKSQRLTAPPVARSMAAQCFSGTLCSSRIRQLLTVACVTPMAFASATTPPAASMALVRASMYRTLSRVCYFAQHGSDDEFRPNGVVDKLASRLKKVRDDRGLTQAELAKLAGVGQSAIGNIESGKRGGLQSLASIALALQVNYRWLRD